MKPPFTFASLLITALICGSAFANSGHPAGELEIGPSAENQVKAGSGTWPNHSGAIGLGNWVAGQGSLSIGKNNQIGYNPANWWGSWEGHYSLAVGYANIIQKSYAAAIGTANYNAGEASLTIGISNSIPFGGEDPTGMYSFISGGYNQSYGSNFSMISGINNTTWGGEGNASLGRGLINSWNYCVIVGNTTTPQIARPDPLFVVGNGTGVANSAGERKNALEVYGDGVVILPKRQGDIRMGEFGNGNGD